MDLSPWIILVLVGAGVSGIVAFMYAGAKSLRHACDVHDLTVRSHTLRLGQLQRLAELRGSDAWGDAELVVDPQIEMAIQQYEQEMQDDEPARRAA